MSRRGRERFVAAPSSHESGGHTIESPPPLQKSPRKSSKTKSNPNAASSSPRHSSVIIDTVNEDAEDSEYNPRSFPYHVKQACWEKAAKIKGRDPDRWRRDALGNTVFRKLVGCPGCLCHDYDHVIPYSKATANRVKSNRTDMSTTDLIQKSAYCRISGRDMDFVELSAYGNVHHSQESGGCRIQ